MNIRLLGTSAAEGFPALFCRCRTCMEARRRGGKNIRTRTSAILDGEIKIDFPPDSMLHMNREEGSAGGFSHLLITHSHHDHFYPDDLNMRAPVFAHNYGMPLHIYGNETVIGICKERLSGATGENFHLVSLQPFQTVEVNGSLVTPLPADHKPDEASFLYFIEKDKVTCLYGHDTGVFPPATMEWLLERVIDIAILDCTNGQIDEKRNHMNIEALQEMAGVFRDKGAFHDGTRIIATHFSHNTGLLHEDLERLLMPSGIEPAYDGMEIEYSLKNNNLSRD